MWRWTWRLVVVVSLALAAGVVALWVRSHRRAEAVFIQRGDRYFQAVSQRGRVMVLRIDDYEPVKDQAVRGYVPEAVDGASKLMKGVTWFRLLQEVERSYGPVNVRDGSLGADREFPKSRRPVRWFGGATSGPTTAGSARPVAMPGIPMRQISDAEFERVSAELRKPLPADSAGGYTLMPPPKGSSKRSDEPSLGLESSALTLAPPPKPPPPPARRDDGVFESPVVLGGGWVGRLAFGAGSGGAWPSFSYRAVSFPHWLALSVLLLPAMISGLGVVRRRAVRRRRRRAGQCVSCGYDLRADVEGRCPECGEAASDGGAAGR